MPRPSSIERLPPDLLAQFQALLRDPRVSQLDATARINAILEEEGRPERVSKSAVNRYAVRMDEVGARLRESRQIAEMWIAKLGAAPQGQIGHLVNEILRTLAFDLALTVQRGEIDPDDAPEVAKMLKNMAIAMERLERAASENVKREEEIRTMAQRDAADAAEKVAKQGGLSAESVQELRRAILGVRS
jgi:HD-GYP domain-containing protein (c-di-GMP phosphodiesterase class II)